MQETEVTLTEVKKCLLKQKPSAMFKYIRQNHAYYFTFIAIPDLYDGEGNVVFGKTIGFKIPVDDMGSTDFLPEMPGQSLIRWIYLSEN
jgi:hypothetical protein